MRFFAQCQHSRAAGQARLPLWQQRPARGRGRRRRHAGVGPGGQELRPVQPIPYGLLEGEEEGRCHRLGQWACLYFIVHTFGLVNTFGSHKC